MLSLWCVCIFGLGVHVSWYCAQAELQSFGEAFSDLSVASLLGARTLLGAPSIATRNKSATWSKYHDWAMHMAMAFIETRIHKRTGDDKLLFNVHQCPGTSITGTCRAPWARGTHRPVSQAAFNGHCGTQSTSVGFVILRTTKGPMLRSPAFPFRSHRVELLAFA